MSDSEPQYDFGEYNYHIQQAIFHDGKKAQEIKLAIEELLIQSYPKEKIATKLKRDLEGKVSDSYINEICSSMGLTDQRFTNKDYLQEQEETEPLEGQIITNDNGDGTQTIIKGGVPVKAPLPEHGNSSSGAGPLGSRPPNLPKRNPYPEENAELISLYEDLCEFIKNGMIPRLKEEAFVSKVDSVEEHIYTARAALDVIKQFWDKRQTVPVAMQLYLTDAVLKNTINHGAQEFVANLKDMAGFTSKQTTKTLQGLVSDIHARQDPQNEQQALLDGLLGVACSKCGSFRTRPTETKGLAHCFECDGEFSFERELLGYTQLKIHDAIVSQLEDGKSYVIGIPEASVEQLAEVSKVINKAVEGRGIHVAVINKTFQITEQPIGAEAA